MAKTSNLSAFHPIQLAEYFSSAAHIVICCTLNLIIRANDVKGCCPLSLTLIFLIIKF